MLWRSILFERIRMSAAGISKYILALSVKKIPAKIITEKFKISEDNVYVIKFRVGKLLEKHGKKYFQAALKKAV